MKYLDQDPPPSSLLFAIRSIWYNFETAVADIIDNSISAAAKHIDLYAEPIGKSYFAFLDDGCGMTEKGLENALLLASDRSKKKDCELELGRYGLGLKSASFSQCRRFYVVTKQRSRVFAMTYGLDDVERSGKWRTGKLSEKEWRTIPEVNRLLALDHGTLVVWQDFDKLEKNASNFETSFRHAVEQARHHVEYVFHRFYDDVVIRFNEERLEKRDPFLLDSYGMQQEGRKIETLLDGHKISITPFSLPYQNALTPEQKKLLGNPSRIYDEQGLYLYRNRRLIAWGGWFRTEVRSEMHKLARVRVDIPSSLDELWMLDVKKSSAKIPDKLRKRIRIAIEDSVRRSSGAVRKPCEKETLAEHKVWERSVKDKGCVEYSINRENPLFATLKESLQSRDLLLLEQFVAELEDYLPKFQIHIAQSDDVKIVNGDSMPSDEKVKMAQLVDRIRASAEPQDREYLLDKYLAFETYMGLRSHRGKLLKEVLHG